MRPNLLGIAAKEGNFQNFSLIDLPGRYEAREVRVEGNARSATATQHCRGQDRRDIILMSRQDIARRGLKVDQLVSVKSRTGEMRYQRVREFDIRPGNAIMYCPECNILFGREVDPQSKTPAFKNELVTVIAEI